jgi:two-component system sensor histidine kinase RstB
MPIPRWRAGRYSLSRIFFNFYLLAMGSFVAIAFFADLVISTALHGITEDYARRFMRGTIELIEEDLQRYPIEHWGRRLRELDNKFSYRIAISERDDLRLSPRQSQILDEGGIAVEREGEIMYHQMNNSALVLMVGPLSPDRNPEERQRGMPLELRIRLLTWSLIGLGFAVALWFWVRPIWRDLEVMRQTARALGEGHLDTRAAQARSPLFAPLFETLDGMADRIQQLLATHKELSCSISHELRTPIARMRFAVEMQRETDAPDERERLTHQMENDLDELDNLIDTSLTYARFERETPVLSLTPVDLPQWLEDQVENMRLLGRELNIEVDHSQWPAGQRVDMDRKVMPHALQNLLRNAIKYARSQIRVSAGVSYSASEAQAWIHVDDDGIGIPEDARERIFAAFTRLDRSRDRATGGYGLGLAITQRVIQVHGGTAQVGDSPLGGARFSLTWPLQQPVATAASAEKAK